MSAQRVLIIDDEENIRTTMRMALEAAGYEVGTAADGPEGLEQFGAGETWDLVLLDQRMPGMDGLEVLRRMRERNPSARILMVTAYGTIELAVDAMKAGAVDFLRKPFTPEVLRGAVKAVLALPHPSLATGEYSLTRLPPPTPPPQEVAAVPLVRYRTLNGFELWPASLTVDEEETEALRVRRAFEVKDPHGGLHRCAVDITTSVRALVQQETGRDVPPEDPIWDTVARLVLSNHLWTKAELPPGNLLVYGLTPDQLLTVRTLAGLGPGPWR
jgi:DNA-binding response OmpR family regulator